MYTHSSSLSHLFNVCGQCATKSVILHLQWTEEDEPSGGMLSLSPLKENRPLTPSLSTSAAGPRTFTRTNSFVTPGRRSSLASHSSISTASVAKGRLSLGPLSPSSPLSPLSPSPRPHTPMYFGRAAVLTAPPKLVGIVETPDVAVGAVDPRKRRVVTATRFSTRVGANRTVGCQCIFFDKILTHLGIDLHVDSPR